MRKQIGWSQEAKLLAEIADKIKRLSKIVGTVTTTTAAP